MTRECTIHDLPPEYEARIVGLLPADETILACVESYSKAGDTTRILSEVVLQDNGSRDYHMAYVVTQKQLVMLGTDDYWPSPFVQTMRLSDIVNVRDVQQGMAGVAIVVNGPDRKYLMCRFAEREQATQFVRVLSAAMAGGRAA